VLILPGFVLSFLLALGERDWFHCFAYADNAEAPRLPSIFAPGELTPILLETLTPPVSNPALFAWHFGPTVGFALLFGLTRSRLKRRVLFIALALYLACLLWMLLPLSGQHSCDSSGAGSRLTLPVFTGIGIFAALFAHRLACLIGAYRHDPP